MKVILIGGFLGSGKTTFIKILAEFLVKEKRQKVVIIENEAGEIGLDDKILSLAGFQVRELFGGCICCSLTGELTLAVNQVKEQFNPDWIIVEATGVAKPMPIADTIRKYGKDIGRVLIIVLVDASRWLELTEILPELIFSQVASANVMLVNKIDGIESVGLSKILKQLRDNNPRARILTASLLKGVDEYVLGEICSSV